MPRNLKTLGAAALATVACVASAAGAAHAEPTSIYAPSALVLTIGRGDQAASTAVRAVTLSCAPQPQGTHPAPRAACAELRAVRGDVALLATASTGQDCTQVWEPVTVTADGVWQGQRVAWQATYSNSCRFEAALSESAVFNF